MRTGLVENEDCVSIVIIHYKRGCGTVIRGLIFDLREGIFR